MLRLVEQLKKLARGISPFRPGEEVCFFIPESSKGWILEAALREISDRFDGKYSICHDFALLPKSASAFYFVHYHFYLHAAALYPWLAEKNNVVWFTHPKDEALGGRTAVDMMKRAHVVTMCSRWRNYLIDLGLCPNRVTTIIGGADPKLFTGHQRGAGKIGFCTAYYERKHPDRIIEIVKMLPQRQFVLMGRNWDKYARFDEMQRLDNFEYRVTEYEHYPAFYRELDVFVSVSQLEGGPIPLLESMMSNVVPVASDTGFAPDLIDHGKNGFLFPALDTPSASVADFIEQALELTSDVRASVVQFDWDNYAAKHHRLLRTVIS